MYVEKIGGANHYGHAEIWGTEQERLNLEFDNEKIEELCDTRADVVYFAKDTAEVYYLDKELKQFKKIGE